MDDLTPKSLVLQLLSVADGPLEASALVRAGEILGLQGGAVRVALSRLSRVGRVESVRRGEWGLTVEAARVADQVATWRAIGDRVRPWTGTWVGVATGDLPLSDRVARRQREQALTLLGFRRLRRGLQIRPDNRESVDELAERLRALGLESTAPVFAMGQLGGAQRHALALWDGATIDGAVRTARRRLEGVTVRLQSLGPEAAARETFLAGSQAIRVLALDPLLPEPIVDGSARSALVDEMQAFDRLGRRAWQRLVSLQEVA